MNKRTRTLLEGDAYELPHVQEILEEYDRFAKAIGQVRNLVFHYRNETSSSEVLRKWDCASKLQSIIQGLTPESERAPLGSHASDLACLRATQKQVDYLHSLLCRWVNYTDDYYREDTKKYLADNNVHLHGNESCQLRCEQEVPEWDESEVDNRPFIAQITELEQKLSEANKRNDMLEDRLAAEINKFCNRTTERDDWRSRALKAESRLESVSDAIGAHLDEKGLRSTEE